MASLSDQLDAVLGASAAKLLAAELGVHTVGDLLRHYPLRYGRRGDSVSVEAPEEGLHVTVIGHVVKAQKIPMKQRRGTLFKVEVDTGTGAPVRATFFSDKPSYLLKPGVRAMFSGEVKYWGQSKNRTWELSHPSYFLLAEADEPEASSVAVHGGGQLRGLASSAAQDGLVDPALFDREFYAIYPATAKLQTWTISRCVRQVLDQLDTVEDPYDADLLAQQDFDGLDWALRAIHLPDTMADVDRAQTRLRFDEAASIALVLTLRKHAQSELLAPSCPVQEGGIEAEFARRLPFTLTGGQAAALEEISTDLAQPHPMSRLLQGEVGSGKTIVALMAMLQVVGNGYQCALLAPTEVLAAQHYRSIRETLGSLGDAGELGAHDHATAVALLTGSMTTAQKREALLRTVCGDAGIVIGTHALIQDHVDFHRLGLIVIDEQHRFGVEQRDALRGRAPDGSTPHTLVMTATPIPRTIAMTVLGDLETSTLRELPRNRQPITTNAISERDNAKWVPRVWERIREEVAQGRQAYVVCSRIGDDEGKRTDESGQAPEDPTTTSVLAQFEALRHGPLADLRVGLLHGRLSGADKDAVMQAFNAGEIDVLVCTTVIEVGIDVPNATVMVIVDADRFGISQLHQLRGRVGRGIHPSLCILMTKLGAGSGAMQRISHVAKTQDGFALADYDLQTRKEGDVLGARQSGTVRTLRLLSLLHHGDVIEDANRFVRSIVAQDPDLSEHPGLRRLIEQSIRGDRAEYLAKS